MTKLSIQDSVTQAKATKQQTSKLQALPWPVRKMCFHREWPALVPKQILPVASNSDVVAERLRKSGGEKTNAV